MKYLGLALILFGMGAAMVFFNREERAYVPLVRLRTAEGLFITAVQPQTSSRSSCKEAIERFVQPLGIQCKECAIESQCVTELSGMELALAKGRDVPVYTVISKSARLALVGPTQTLQRDCEQLALQVGSSGNASCVTPRKGSDSGKDLYHPVVRLALPDGLSITALLPQIKGQDACASVNERFLSPFKECKECKVAFARCERELEGIERAMQDGDPVPHPMVIARDLRIAVMGPPDAAKIGCQVVAADIVTKGLPSAACIQPKQVGSKR